MKEKGGKRLYTLDAMRRVKYLYVPECRRKGFSNLVDLATIFRLRDFSSSLKR